MAAGPTRPRLPKKAHEARVGGLFLTLLGALACTGPRQEAAAPPPDAGAAPAAVKAALAAIVATCAEVKGTVEVRRRGETTWEPAAVGTTLREGDAVRTGPRSYARIGLLESGHLELQAETTIQVDLAAAKAQAAAGSRQVVVAVEQGTARGALTGAEGTAASLAIQERDGSRAEIVRGAGSEPTEFRVTAAAERPTEIAVERGKATVVTGDTETPLESRQAVEVSRGKASAVITLLAFPPGRQPGIDARYHLAEGLAIKLRWAPVKGAARYRVEIANDMSFTSPVDSAETDGLSHVFSPAAEGMYVWRVVAIDASGRHGEYNFARRLFCETEPPRDLLVAPKGGEQLAFVDARPRVRFSWQSAGGSSAYRLLIGRGEDPRANTVFNKVTTGQQIEVDVLGEGDYAWGVYARGEGEEKPIFLEPRRLVIRRARGPKVDTDELWKGEPR